METRAGREEWIDALKGLGIFLMVTGHTGFPYKWIIYGFHMPLFFIVAGYLHKERQWKDRGIKKYISCRFRSYVTPYFILSGVNLLICAGRYLLKHGTQGLSEQLFKWCFGIVWSYGDAQHTPNCTPLWFLIGLFVSQLLFICLLALKGEVARAVVCAVFLAGAALLAGQTGFQPPWNFDAALLGCIFLYLGYLIKKYKILEKGSAVFLVSGVLGAVCILCNPRLKGMVSNDLGNPFLYFAGAFGTVILLMGVIRRLSGFFGGGYFPGQAGIQCCSWRLIICGMTFQRPFGDGCRF